MRSTTARMGFLFLLIVAEALAFSVAFDAGVLFERSDASGYGWLSYSGLATKVLVAWGAALLVALGPQLSHWFEQLLAAASAHRYRLLLALQFCAFILFFLASAHISTKTDRWNGTDNALPVAWMTALVFVAALWVAALAPVRFWLRFVRDEALTITFACGIAAIVWTFAMVTQDLWNPLSTVTFHSVAALLQWFYADLVVEPEQRVLGVNSFLVEIASACSGYEGIGLVLIFTGFYLFIFRKDFRFPHGLLLLPLGVAAIWSFNTLRIAVLLVIGAEISPELAVGGFHSLAGWISFVLVTAGLLLLAHNSHLFSASPGQADKQPVSFRMALLIPLVVLLGTTMITSAMTISVDWWYPLRVVLTAGALALLWKHYRSFSFHIGWPAVAVGAIVFLFWVLLVADDPVTSSLTSRQLHEISPSLQIAWLLFRTLGAVVTVPIAEELAFRGYLFERSGNDSRPERFPWAALIVSSVLFGLLHSAWVAGVLAGIAYGLVRYHRGHVVDAIVAHATTNALLTGYVLMTGRWSLW
jgi:exosortase E/protease (VPEID-CTERM system)